MFGVWSLTVGVIEKIHTKPTGWAVAGGETSKTHTMAHAQGSIAVTVIIIKQEGSNSILNSVHETVLICIWWRSY